MAVLTLMRIQPIINCDDHILIQSGSITKVNDSCCRCFNMRFQFVIVAIIEFRNTPSLRLGAQCIPYFASTRRFCPLNVVIITFFFWLMAVQGAIQPTNIRTRKRFLEPNWRQLKTGGAFVVGHSNKCYAFNVFFQLLEVDEALGFQRTLTIGGNSR